MHCIIILSLLSYHLSFLPHVGVTFLINNLTILLQKLQKPLQLPLPLPHPELSTVMMKEAVAKAGYTARTWIGSNLTLTYLKSSLLCTGTMEEGIASSFTPLICGEA